MFKRKVLRLALPALTIIALGFLPAVSNAQFLNLKLGMATNEALLAVGKSEGAIGKLRNGKAIIKDTITVGGCGFLMPRSSTIDTSGTLDAVGLTFKTTREDALEKFYCTKRWIAKSLGLEPTDDPDKQIQLSTWKLGDAIVTLEAKAYDKDYFVLVYYYNPQK